MYATRSPFFTPIACSAEDQRSQRAKNSSYVRRRSPSITPSRSPYSLRVRRANSSGVSGVSMCPAPSRSRVEHQREIGRPDPPDEGAVRLRLQLDGTLIHKCIDVVEVPIAVALDAQPVAKALVLPAALEQVGRASVQSFQDLQLHAQLGDGLGIALLFYQLLDLCFEVGDLLLVVVHLASG